MDKEKLYFILAYVSVAITAFAAVAILLTGGKVHEIFAIIPCGCTFLFNNLFRVEHSKKEKEKNDKQNDMKQ